ncbi:hypothetical protein [Aeromonas caviae]
MLESIRFIQRLEDDLRENVEHSNIQDFYIELRVNQTIEVYVVSDIIYEKSDLYLKSIFADELENENIDIVFLSSAKANSDDYEHLFKGDKTSYGLRRSLGALLSMKKSNDDNGNVVTFFSYKGAGPTHDHSLHKLIKSRSVERLQVRF